MAIKGGFGGLELMGACRPILAMGGDCTLSTILPGGGESLALGPADALSAGSAIFDRTMPNPAGSVGNLGALGAGGLLPRIPDSLPFGWGPAPYNLFTPLSILTW